MVLTIKQIDAHAREIGAKTKNLKKLYDAGFQVPPFLALPSSTIKKIYIDKKNLEEVVVQIQALLPHTFYAVRSSALIEDATNTSYAGQFMTKVAVDANDLAAAILEVIAQAHDYLKGNLAKFSLIIQEYIEADYAGVAFTRNPQGGREMIIEYHKGRGEELVSGEVKPERLSLYHTRLLGEENISLPNVTSAIKAIKKIEAFFSFPQDIEWCVLQGKWYFLQSRPITTITKNEYEQDLYLDAVLAQIAPFYYEKTAICEIAPRPSPVTYDLLKGIYAKGGPVERVYAKHSIRYHAQNFLTIIGNELYVDREAELKTLLPSYSYFDARQSVVRTPRFATMRGILTTIKNFFNLARLPLTSYLLLHEKIKSELLEDLPLNTSFKERCALFYKKYELIFEVNLLAEKALKQLEYATRSWNIPLTSLLDLAQAPQEIKFPSLGLIGNSLDLNDQTPFLAANKKSDRALNVELDLPTYKRKFVMPYVQTAANFIYLREAGRWLTVTLVNYLRGALLKEAKNLIKQSKEYEKYSAFTLPVKLTHSIEEVKTSAPLGVSPGSARGYLADEAHIYDYKEAILYTKMLSPTLTEYFGTVKGIVSDQGGMLSHLAIMAREYNIPVVVNVSLNTENIQLGDYVEMEGASGTVKKVLKIRHE